MVMIDDCVALCVDKPADNACLFPSISIMYSGYIGGLHIFQTEAFLYNSIFQSVGREALLGGLSTKRKRPDLTLQ